MPKRPRAHQIEDISKTAFRRALPPNWVVRDKDRDYGVDQEVEIFDTENNSTGYIFFVQLRATDSIPRSTKFKISIEQLKYFYSLQLPTLLVRYSTKDDRIFARWHFNMKPTLEEEKQKSITFSFSASEEWQTETPDEIFKTMQDLYAWQNSNSSTVILLKAENRGVSRDLFFELKRTLEVVTENAPCLATEVIAPNSVEIRVSIAPNMLLIHCGTLFSFSFEFETLDERIVTLAIAYPTLLILGSHSLVSQSEQIAFWILGNKLKTRSKELAYRAACRLSSTPELAVRIAILNELHIESDFYFISFLIWLHTLPEHLKSAELIEMYLSAHLKNMLASGKVEAAAGACYSIANNLSSENLKREAFHYFNKARKLFPDYMRREYFLKEVGGVLFLNRKYRCAATAYKQANAIKADKRTEFGLADSLLFCGNLSKARFHFLECEKHEGVMADEELALKLFLCEQLSKLHASAELPVRATEASRLTRLISKSQTSATKEDWAAVIKIDAFNEVANYNWATFQFEEKRFDNALLGYLICGFRQPNDEEAWCNAISSAISMNRDFIISWVIATSTRLCGRRPYDNFRQQLEVSGAPSELKSVLDAMFEQVRFVSNTVEKNNLLLRDISTGKPLDEL